jgi:diguanylate cyclase (GGDEF)-like protein/PAS domain S-box-containing protein
MSKKDASNHQNSTNSFASDEHTENNHTHRYAIKQMSHFFIHNQAALQTLLASPVLGIGLTSDDGMLLEANPRFMDLVGLPWDQIQGKPLLSILSLNSATNHSQNAIQGYLGDEGIYQEWVIKTTSLNTKKVQGMILPIIEGTTTTHHMIVIVPVVYSHPGKLDIKELLQAVEQSEDWFVITDKEGNIVYVNATVERITGYAKSELIGVSPSIWKSNKHDKNFYTELWQMIQEGGIYRNIIINRTKTGNLFYLDVSIHAIYNSDERITHYISTGKDITEAHRTDEHLKSLAYYDVLTQLPNQSLFIDRLEQAMGNADANNSHVALWTLNINQFVYIHDTFGHETADELLKAVASRLTRHNDKGNTVARIGESEFAVIFSQVSHPKDAAFYVDVIMQDLVQPYRVLGNEIVLSYNMGLAIFPEDSTDAKQLLGLSRIALAQSRHRGTNKCAFYTSPMNSQAREFLFLVDKLVEALKNQEFVPFFQPYFETHTNRLAGMEALIRWETKDQGMVSPAVFIPAMEETGIITQLWEITIEQVCKQIHNWLDAGYEMVPISVNVSPVQFRHKEFITKVQILLEQYQVDPRLLVIEITESAMMDDINISVNILKQLKEIGIAVAIDDFGTGYSSLGYLKQFPLDFLKIDISFIRELAASKADEAIVHAINTLAQTLNLKTIAEGVETKVQVDILKRLGCNYLQGYYFARPVPASALQDQFLQFSQPAS